jgi:hypothetical protein
VGTIEKIPFEDLHDVGRLRLFCDGILIARKSKQFLREEELYWQLIKLLRTPHAMIALTRRNDSHAPRLPASAAEEADAHPKSD